MSKEKTVPPLRNPDQFARHLTHIRHLLEREQSIEIDALPGAEDDKLLDEVVRLLASEKDWTILEVNVRKCPPGKVIHCLRRKLIEGIVLAQGLEKDDGDAQESEDFYSLLRQLSDLAHSTQHRTVFVIRKLHYAYFNRDKDQDEVQDIFIFLRPLLGWYNICCVLSSYIPLSRIEQETIKQQYGSALSNLFYIIPIS